MECSVGFEPTIEGLQPTALPLGYEHIVAPHSRFELLTKGLEILCSSTELMGYVKWRKKEVSIPNGIPAVPQFSRLVSGPPEVIFHIGVNDET